MRRATARDGRISQAILRFQRSILWPFDGNDISTGFDVPKLLAKLRLSMRNKFKASEQRRSRMINLYYVPTVS